MKSLPVVCLLLFTLVGPALRLHAQSSAFTYQGRLAAAGTPAAGSYDLRFTLYDAPANGNLLAAPLTNSAVVLSNGLFTTSLDFGPNVFTGPARWLEIALRPSGTGAFTPLSPRQALTPAPYALYAPQAGNALTAGSVAAANLTGTIPMANLPPATITNGGIVSSNLFSFLQVQPMGAQNLICRLPPLGVETWYEWGPTLDEPSLLAQVDILATNGYTGLGWKYIVIDDGWNVGRTNGHLVADPVKWPSFNASTGFSNLCWRAHSRGVGLVIYTEDRLRCNVSPAGTPPAYSQTDAVDFANWGFDAVKFDTTSLNGGVNTHEGAVQNLLQFAGYWFAAATNRPTWLQSDAWATIDPRVVAVCARTRAATLAGGDKTSWWQFLNYVDIMTRYANFISPGHFIDGDHVSFVANSVTNMSQATAGMYAMFSAPLFMPQAGLPQNNPTVYNYFCNPDLLAIDQDPACLPPVMVSSNNSAQVFYKRLSDGRLAIALFNRDGSLTQNIGFQWSDLGLPVTTPLNLTEVWSKQLTTAQGAFTNTVPALTARLYLASKAIGVTTNYTVPGGATLYITNGLIMKIQ